MYGEATDPETNQEPSMLHGIVQTWPSSHSSPEYDEKEEDIETTADNIPARISKETPTVGDCRVEQSTAKRLSSLFEHIPFLGWRKSNAIEQDGVDATEQTSLLGGVRSDGDRRNIRASFSAASKWQDISDRAKNGFFLLNRSIGKETSKARGRIKGDVDEAREQKQREIQGFMEFSLLQCIAAIILYLTLSVLAFSFVFDHWTLIDSMYFAVVTFTTIGYGDLVPDTYAGRIFTCVYALSGVACLGVALGVVGNNLIEAEEKAMESAREKSMNYILHMFSSNSNDSVHDSLRNDNPHDNKHGAPVQCKHHVAQVLAKLAGVVAIILIFAYVVAEDPGIDSGWDMGDALYFAIITATTVGYGDFAPKSQQDRLLAVFFIPVAVGAMGHWLALVAGWIMDSRQSRWRKQLEMKELSQEDIDLMDEDGDGEVSRAEFLEFMLVAMNKVDRDLLLELRRHFSRMDRDGSGSLSKEDLIHAARSKLQNPRRKLALATYKQELLDKSRSGSENRA